MTNLNFPVRRRTRDAYPVLRHKPEKIVVTLFPGDVLVLRKERGRHEWYLSIAAPASGTGGDHGEPCATVMLPGEE